MSPMGFSVVEAAIIIEAKTSHKKQDYFVLCSPVVGEKGSFWKGKQAKTLQK